MSVAERVDSIRRQEGFRGIGRSSTNGQASHRGTLIWQARMESARDYALVRGLNPFDVFLQRWTPRTETPCNVNASSASSNHSHLYGAVGEMARIA